MNTVRPWHQWLLNNLAWLSLTDAILAQNSSWHLHGPSVRTVMPLIQVLRILVKGKGKGKGKAIPLQAWTGPEGSRRLRLPDFKTVVT